MHYAVAYESIDTLRTLILEAGCSPDEVTADGRMLTPLHIAAKLKRADCIDALIWDCGASLWCTDAIRRHPFDLFHDPCIDPHLVTVDAFHKRKWKVLKLAVDPSVGFDIDTFVRVRWVVMMMGLAAVISGVSWTVPLPDTMHSRGALPVMWARDERILI